MDAREKEEEKGGNKKKTNERGNGTKGRKPKTRRYIYYPVAYSYDWVTVM